MNPPPTALPATETATKCTLSGRPIPPLPRGLPKTVESVCPECLRLIPARLEDRDGEVWMTKTCPEHGPCEDIYWRDARLYLKAEAFHYGDGDGLANPTAPVRPVPRPRLEHRPRQHRPDEPLQPGLPHLLRQLRRLRLRL